MYEVTGHLGEIVFLLWTCGTQGSTSGGHLAGKPLYPLIHLGGPSLLFLFQFQWVCTFLSTSKSERKGTESRRDIAVRCALWQPSFCQLWLWPHNPLYLWSQRLSAFCSLGWLIAAGKTIAREQMSRNLERVSLWLPDQKEILWLPILFWTSGLLHVSKFTLWYSHCVVRKLNKQW